MKGYFRVSTVCNCTMCALQAATPWLICWLITGELHSDLPFQIPCVSKNVVHWALDWSYRVSTCVRGARHAYYRTWGIDPLLANKLTRRLEWLRPLVTKWHPKRNSKAGSPLMQSVGQVVRLSLVGVTKIKIWHKSWMAMPVALRRRRFWTNRPMIPLERREHWEFGIQPFVAVYCCECPPSDCRRLFNSNESGVGSENVGFVRLGLESLGAASSLLSAVLGKWYKLAQLFATTRLGFACVWMQSSNLYIFDCPACAARGRKRCQCCLHCRPIMGMTSQRIAFDRFVHE